MSRWSWLLLVSTLALSCSKKEDPGPPCAQVADHVADVMSKAYPGHGDMMPAGARKSWVASCESRKLTAAQRRCMMEGQTPDALSSCVREKAAEKKPDRPGAPPAAPAAPAASAASGSAAPAASGSAPAPASH